MPNYAFTTGPRDKIRITFDDQFKLVDDYRLYLRLIHDNEPSPTGKSFNLIERAQLVSLGATGNTACSRSHIKNSVWLARSVFDGSITDPFLLRIYDFLCQQERYGYVGSIDRRATFSGVKRKLAERRAMLLKREFKRSDYFFDKKDPKAKPFKRSDYYFDKPTIKKRKGVRRV